MFLSVGAKVHRMVKTPGGYFTNTEIEQVFKDIVEGEIITIK